ncbi:hypothetical protein [Alkalihalobacillus sp. LMS39]|uniref:hypothetical protein n=1 Tax=Alkalihalobacillus sp. LMS39 TaxID=2924032 RepID=UPI001FB32E58|nr:hypothetical protein [Alkalihalobacillus sp. LMS39]UOE93606.1 hypothetical protein MM271_20860 [Alkalihalobacillus sp. LMS39]
MNKTEIAIKVSERSGVHIEDCIKVITEMEEVVSEELSKSKNMTAALEQVFQILRLFTAKG